MATIKYLKGDIFTSDAQVIVNTVNCKGVMGKGLALAFKQRYPDMFAVYEQDCKTGKLQIGRPTIYLKSTPWILNFPTKNHWRFPSKIEYIEKGLAFFAKQYKKADIKSIAFPKLGAQNGLLSWNEVGPVMAKYLSQLDIPVYIYIADGDEEYQYDPVAEAKTYELIWQGFSEIALSAERLCNEVGLSSAQAQKIADKRLAAPFGSLADIENIDKIAKISVNKIKKFTQEHNMAELSGMPERQNANSQKKPDLSRTPKKKKKADVSANIIASALFEF